MVFIRSRLRIARLVAAWTLSSFKVRPHCAQECVIDRSAAKTKRVEFAHFDGVNGLGVHAARLSLIVSAADSSQNCVCVLTKIPGSHVLSDSSTVAASVRAVESPLKEVLGV